MTIKLQGKLFIAFVCATASVLLAVAWFINWSFDKGFREYLSKSAIERTEPIRTALQEHYRERGSWQDLQQNPELLRRIIIQSMSPKRQQRFLSQLDQGPNQPISRQQEKQRRKLFDRYFRDARFLRVYDLDGKLVINSPAWPTTKKDELSMPLMLAGEPIGTFAIRKIKLKNNRADYQFRERQLRQLWKVVAFALLVSALLAWLLARHLIRPIRALAKGAAALGEGDYQTRVILHGRDELASLGHEFNHLARTLADNQQARQRWIADISHELRTPLAVLRGEIEAVLDGVRELDSQNVQSLHEEVLALSHLVDDLYQLALSDAGALDYRFAKEDARELLERALDVYAERYRQAQLQLHAPDLAQLQSAIRADAKRFIQLLHNLLENSLRYTDPGGQVILRTERLGDQLKITLTDSAPGVKPEDLPKIFDRLFRVDQSRSRQHGGSGLGLSLCKNIAVAHGGDISAAAAPIGGLEITLVWPLWVDDSSFA